MKILDFLSELLGTFLTPFAIAVTTTVICHRIPFPTVSRLRRSLSEAYEPTRKKTAPAKSSPFSALSVALAGTLGVGNITGVSSALISGGAGAVFWMWVGAIVSAAIKYAEVYLAVRFRREERGRCFGGAMYYIRDGLSRTRGMSYRTTAVLGGIFALLCCLNSLITGNIIQSNAAACLLPTEYRAVFGFVLGTLVLASLLYGSKKVEQITARLMPPLTLGYLLLSVAILLCNASLVPTVLRDIFVSALSPRSVLGGTVGFTVREGIRYGVMRGIFSNEAGCGTSPTAHASADVKSPRYQAYLGIAEVLFDTLILCTATALVLLVADERYGILPWKTDADSAAVTILAFRSLAGEVATHILTAAVFLFAYAAVIAQIFYGVSAIGYLTRNRLFFLIYYVCSVVCTVLGAVASAPVLWLLADIVLGLMTVCNCAVIILLRRSIE